MLVHKEYGNCRHTHERCCPESVRCRAGAKEPAFALLGGLGPEIIGRVRVGKRRVAKHEKQPSEIWVCKGQDEEEETNEKGVPLALGTVVCEHVHVHVAHATQQERGREIIEGAACGVGDWGQAGVRTAACWVGVEFLDAVVLNGLAAPTVQPPTRPVLCTALLVAWILLDVQKKESPRVSFLW
jgi:hypothetical protein